MKTYHQKTFTTGEFAKLLDVNKDTLLYYDKIDLFKPAGTHANGYRYYTFEQYDQFMAIHSLRQVELPIKELKAYFEAPSAQSLEQLAQKQSEHVALELQKLQDIQFFLQRVLQLTNELQNITFGEVLFQELPEESIVLSEEKIDWSLPIEELYELSSQFLKELGVKSTATHGLIYANEQFLQEEDSFHYLFCRIDLPNAQKKPAGLYAIIYHKGSFDFVEETTTKLMDTLAAHQLEMDGDVYEEYLLHSIVAVKEEDAVTKFSVKVKPIASA